MYMYVPITTHSDKKNEYLREKIILSLLSQSRLPNSNIFRETEATSRAFKKKKMNTCGNFQSHKKETVNSVYL